MSSRIRQSCLLGVVDFACTGHGERRCSQQAGPQTISWWRQGVIDLAVDSTISAPIFVSQDSRVLFVRAPRADFRGQGPEKLLGRLRSPLPSSPLDAGICPVIRCARLEPAVPLHLRRSHLLTSRTYGKRQGLIWPCRLYSMCVFQDSTASL